MKTPQNSSKLKSAIQLGIAVEAFEMVGKATTMTAAEMDTEKKQQLNAAMDSMIHGKASDRVMSVANGAIQTFGLSVANGVARGHEALATVREDAATNRGYAIAKGVVNVPLQMVRGITIDTMKEVTESAIQKLPDLVESRTNPQKRLGQEAEKIRGEM